ncbi:ribosome maturation factor RimP [Pseudovibrio brasiliensis]|uniref:Ribosome maturation factor RimP n=1 Tax=Pseudovibrio brasiliensis TaxID=1898042 RepID=A0ABX8AP38_9HYPH|nr:ribosome maturation factor RimP [Pseudovibrio brasiliensis]QUS55997.1 ribosome maturation factor RimP [Pseudovibrio brasiliensis]
MDETDPRIVKEKGLEARVAEIVEPVIVDLGYRLVRIRVNGNNGCTLQIMAERPDGTMAVEDCEEISHAVSPALDVDDPISGAYHLEVSSPGIDRPLVRAGDFERWAGHVVKIEMSVPQAGRKRYRGHIIGVEEGNAVIRMTDVQEGQDEAARLPLDEIGSAVLVLTDELIDAALKADKAAKAARGEPTDDDSYLNH